ncbi:MAG: hypothetical protein J6334_08570 [Kiritimatiellae bacterium]|nr:hypothetical protein [Kiritimatiellia bacterium]
MFNWKVLFVKPRTEKKVADYCNIYGIPYYLPLREKSRIVQRRKVKVQLPLFPGYVFVEFATGSQRLQLLQTNCLVKILVPRSGYQLARQLVQVRRALKIDPTLVPDMPLEKGKRVRVISGPFMGMEGLITDLRGRKKRRVVMNLEMIGQSISVEVEPIDIELVDEPKKEKAKKRE